MAKELFFDELQYQNIHSFWETWAYANGGVAACVGREEALYVAAAGASVLVNQHVGRNAVLIVSGGSVTCHVRGDIEAGACVLVSGGGACLTVDGAVHPEATVYVRGGGATAHIHAASLHADVRMLMPDYKTFHIEHTLDLP